MTAEHRFDNFWVILPGVLAEDLKLSLEGGNTLVLQGERRPPADFGKEGTIYNQLAYGKFERRLELPSGLDVDKMQAHMHDGLLDIRIPVGASVKPKQIKITSGEERKTLAAA